MALSLGNDIIQEYADKFLDFRLCNIFVFAE